METVAAAQHNPIALAAAPAAAAAPSAAELRYVKHIEGTALIDDPAAGQTWYVRAGDKLREMTVVSVDAAAVRLTNPERVLAFTGPPPPLPTQRLFPTRHEEIPVVYAPGVQPDPARERELQRANETRRHQPGEARQRRTGR